jgi:hypothetical protein
MALLDSGQFHNPCLGHVEDRDRRHGERGEHDKGTKPADTRPHHHGGAPTGVPAETVLAGTRRHSVSALTRKCSSIASGANAGARTCNLLGTPPNALVPHARAIRRGGQGDKQTANGRAIETYRSEGRTPTNAASPVCCRSPDGLTVGFELIMAARPQPGRDSSRDSAPSEIIPVTYGICDGGLDGHPPRRSASHD